MTIPNLSQDVQRTLRNLGVQAVYLFGSRAQGCDTALSDYDYAILTEKGHYRSDKLYDSLYELLACLSPRTIANDMIDIVFLRDASLELRFHIICSGLVLLDADPMGRFNFESYTTLLYCDYRPILDDFDQAILKSL